jgi:GT2 family glycosyltransferase
VLHGRIYIDLHPNSLKECDNQLPFALVFMVSWNSVEAACRPAGQSAKSMSETEQSYLVSIVIVCHNDGKWLPRCLESVQAQTIFEQLEVIIADNVSEDGSDKLARSLIADWPNARFLPTGGDFGFGVACNIAAQTGSGKYVYLLNPDTWLEPDCIEKLYKGAESTSAGIASGLVLEYDDNTIQADGCRGFDLCGNGLPIRKGHMPPVLLFPATFFFIRRELFLRIGMMDQKFFMYGEEMDLAWRAWIAGERICPVPDSRIHHRGAVGVNPVGDTRAVENRTSIQKRFLANRNRLVYLVKDCQHILLMLVLPCLTTVVLEGLLTLTMTRRWSLAKATCWDAIVGVWRLRSHIQAERRRIASFRQRSDWWMLRFFGFGFARWHEVSKILKAGFPRFR